MSESGTAEWPGDSSANAGVGAEVRVVVVGGANTDIAGRSIAKLLERDSNPGRVNVSDGGVGRNIAENLARLGARVELVTAFGGDHNARELRAGCEKRGIGTGGSVVAEDLPGSLYIALLDSDGDMALAMNDMRALERLTPDAIDSARPMIGAAGVVVLDANPSAEVLERAVAVAEVPVLLDPVSAAKAPKAAGILASLAALKCNALEAATLAETAEPETRDEVEAVAGALVRRGVGTVYVTTGVGGVHYRSADETGWVDAPQVQVTNATGAGDAFSAGVAYGMARGWGARRCARIGSELAAAALRSEQTVSDQVRHALTTLRTEEST